MTGLDTDYLRNLMKICSLDRNNFNGVFSCDNFYLKAKEGQINLSPGNRYIINLSSSNHQGSHWVAIQINTPHEAEYFDSYGLQCFDDFIKRALEEKNITIQTFKKTIQDPLSQSCGFFCIAYLISREVNISKTEFATFFSSKNLIDNDRIAIQIIKTFIETTLSV